MQQRQLGADVECDFRNLPCALGASGGRKANPASASFDMRCRGPFADHIRQRNAQVLFDQTGESRAIVRSVAYVVEACRIVRRVARNA